MFDICGIKLQNKIVVAVVIVAHSQFWSDYDRLKFYEMESFDFSKNHT